MIWCWCEGEKKNVGKEKVVGYSLEGKKNIVAKGETSIFFPSSYNILQKFIIPRNVW